MLKKTIKYVDYNGVEREEDFYFNLSKAELIEMQMSTSGGLAELIQTIVKTQDTPSLVKIFKDLIVKSYGEKSLDGKHFLKIDASGNLLANNFVQTEAYSELFMELSTDDGKAAEFINGIVPKEIAEEYSKSLTPELSVVENK